MPNKSRYGNSAKIPPRKVYDKLNTTELRESVDEAWNRQESKNFLNFMIEVKSRPSCGSLIKLQQWLLTSHGLEIDQSTLSRWESGNFQKASFSKVNRLIKCLGASLWQVFGRDVELELKNVVLETMAAKRGVIAKHFVYREFNKTDLYEISCVGVATKFSEHDLENDKAWSERLDELSERTRQIVQRVRSNFPSSAGTAKTTVVDAHEPYDILVSVGDWQQAVAQLKLPTDDDRLVAEAAVNKFLTDDAHRELVLAEFGAKLGGETKVTR